MKKHTFKVKEAGDVIKEYSLKDPKRHIRGKEVKTLYSKDNLRENYYEPRVLPDYDYFERRKLRNTESVASVDMKHNLSVTERLAEHFTYSFIVFISCIIIIIGGLVFLLI